jgi:hypothetical protein
MITRTEQRTAVEEAWALLKQAGAVVRDAERGTWKPPTLAWVNCPRSVYRF